MKKLGPTMNYRPIDLHKKKSVVLAVTCSDPRFQTAYRQLIDDLGEYYDLLVFPGASKPIAEEKLVLDNITLLHSLHHFESIHIFDHVHCGAFGEVENEEKAHKEMLGKAKKVLKKALPGVEVTGYLVSEREAIKL